MRRSIVESVILLEIGLYVGQSGWHKNIGLWSIKSLSIVPDLLLRVQFQLRCFALKSPIMKKGLLLLQSWLNSDSKLLLINEVEPWQ